MRQQIMTPKALTGLVGALCALSWGAGCDDSAGTGRLANADRLDWGAPTELALTAGCDDATEVFREAAITQMEIELDYNMRCFRGDVCGYSLASGAEGDAVSDGAPSQNAGDDQTPDDYSETNVQVEGVDEADFVKTNGTHLFGLWGRDLVIHQTWPAAQTRELGRLTLRGYPQSFFLDDTRKLAIAVSYGNFHEFLPVHEGDVREGDEDYSAWRGVTLMSVVDVSDPAAPRVVTEHVLDGWSLSSRRIDGKIYLAQTTWHWIPGVQTWPEDVQWDDPAADVEAAFEALRARNTALIRATPIDHWIPKRYALDADGHVDPSAGIPITDCAAGVYRSNVYTGGQQILSVVTVDLDKTGEDSVFGSSVIGNWGTVYASQDALYIGATNWGWYWWWEFDGDAAPPITTRLHKFGFDDQGRARYSASGEVLGYALNQFSFDEYGGYLRVATTDGFGWWNQGDQSESRVTVMEQRGTRLVQTGLVSGLGKGERIFAVRFVGDTGYVVTFRQVDPLYVIDLTDPAAPTTVGELKIPGFSSYLHPLGPDHLLAIGRDGTDDGTVTGLQFQIFDVSDPSAPTAAHKTTLGDSWNTWSDAQWDHHAFVYFASRQLLAVPVTGWDYDQASGHERYRSSVFVFHVSTDTGITQVGEVSHMGLFEELGVNAQCRDWYGWWEAHVRRGVFIEDYLYSISNLGLVVHDTRDFGAGALVSDVVIDDRDFNGGHSYEDPCRFATEGDDR